MERRTQRTKFNGCVYQELFLLVGARVFILKCLSALGDFSDENILGIL